MREMLSAEIWSIAQTAQGNVVLLRPENSSVAVPVFIGQLEMHSILIGREGISLPRPLTHDLMLNVFRRLGLTLERVEVHELKDSTFHARLIITGKEFSEEAPLVLDSRPSDAFALAVRRRCPILIASQVVEQAGVPVDFFMEGLEEAERSAGPDTAISPLSAEDAEGEKHPELREQIKLQEQLNQAVAAEEYERAAEIRDMLILLDQKGQD
jgi:bifunctional DNase/RNase